MAFKVVMYTDGAASGNPGPGGYGIVLISGAHRKEIQGGYAHTTNNRMELMAVIEGLKALKQPQTEVTVYTDSKYVADAVNKGWVFDWEKKRFSKRKNEDLWKSFLEEYRKHKVRFIWIKGHNDNPENERCDRLAVEASRWDNLPLDNGYFLTNGDGNAFSI